MKSNHNVESIWCASNFHQFSIQRFSTASFFSFSFSPSIRDQLFLRLIIPISSPLSCITISSTTPTNSVYSILTESRVQHLDPTQLNDHHYYTTTHSTSTRHHRKYISPPKWRSSLIYTSLWMSSKHFFIIIHLFSISIMRIYMCYTHIIHAFHTTHSTLFHHPIRIWFLPISRQFDIITLWGFFFPLWSFFFPTAT